jgi:hypothetical protein
MPPDTSTLLDQILDPVTRCLTPEASRRLLDLRADAATQARVDELAEKANEGLLTPDERDEYEAYISAANVVAILQSKVRALSQ